MKFITSSGERSKKLEHLRPLLKQLDANMFYADWLIVLMAIYNETNGSEEGFELANHWSSTGQQKYKGEKDVRNTWRYFKPDHPRPVTIGTLYKMAKGKH